MGQGYTSRPITKLILQTDIAANRDYPFKPKPHFMETALYLTKACGLTTMFYFAYYLLLRNETFFKTNRWFLLAGMATSIVLPFAVFTKVVWVSPQAVQAVNILPIDNIAAAQAAAPTHTPPAFELQWWTICLLLYFIVAALLLARLIIDFKKVMALCSSQNTIRLGHYTIIDSPAAQSPFSFFNYIVYNSAALEPDELQGIISHEKVHSSQRHSIDMLLAQLFCTAFWFNPFAWLYKKAVSQNLEFIADAEAIKRVEDTIAYQKTMLKITLQPQSSTITSHFYQPLIKKRIVMINKPKSKKHNSFKYVVIAPLLIAFTLLFQVKTEAREKYHVVQETPGDTVLNKVKYSLSKNTEEETMNKSMALITNTFGIEASFDAERNNNNEISYIKITLSGKGIDKVYEERNVNGIKNVTVEVSRDANGSVKAFFSNPKTLTVTGNAFKNDTVQYDRMEVAPESILYIVDGIKQPLGADLRTLNIDANQIASINVYKDRETLDKLGEKGITAILEITTNGNTAKADGTGNQVIPKNSSITVETESDGTSKTKSITIQGAIEVSDTTKGSVPNFTLADGNSGFVLKKENTQNDLEYFAKALEQNGITMKYSGVNRNGKGEITKIKISLSKKGAKSEARFESNAGIGSIYIGEQNGNLVVHSME